MKEKFCGSEVTEWASLSGSDFCMYRQSGASAEKDEHDRARGTFIFTNASFIRGNRDKNNWSFPPTLACVVSYSFLIKYDICQTKPEHCINSRYRMWRKFWIFLQHNCYLLVSCNIRFTEQCISIVFFYLECFCLTTLKMFKIMLSFSAY